MDSVSKQWNGPVIEVDDRWSSLSRDQRFEFTAWLDRQMGGHVLGLYRTEYDVIDCPLIRVTRYVKDEQGCAQVDPDNYPELLRETTEHAIREPLPGWWNVAA